MALENKIKFEIAGNTIKDIFKIESKIINESNIGEFIWGYEGQKKICHEVVGVIDENTIEVIRWL